MLCEFVGLPASGKSSLIAETLSILHADGFDIHTHSDLADVAMKEAADDFRFVRNKRERSTLFGCFQFRRDYPEIFDHICASPVKRPGLAYWSMEMLSQYYYARHKVKEAEIVLCDEGLVDRGAACFIGRTDEEAFEAYNRLLPRDFLVVNVAVPMRVSIRRSRVLRNKIPCSNWFDDRDPLEVLAEMNRLTKKAVGIRKDMGLPVIDLDGRRPIEENAELLARDLPGILGLERRDGVVAPALNNVFAISA